MVSMNEIIYAIIRAAIIFTFRNVYERGLIIMFWRHYRVFDFTVPIIIGDRIRVSTRERDLRDTRISANK